MFFCICWINGLSMSSTLRCRFFSLSLISYYAFCSFLKFGVNFSVFYFSMRKAEHLLPLQTKGSQHLVLRPGYDLQTVCDFEPLRFGTSLSLLCFFFSWLRRWGTYLFKSKGNHNFFFLELRIGCGDG